MSANLLYITSKSERGDALAALCLDENYTLTVCGPQDLEAQQTFDLIFCDCETGVPSGFDTKTIPIVAVYDVTDETPLSFETGQTVIDVLAFPFNGVETIARLRCLSRLHMLQDELSLRISGLMAAPTDSPVLIIGNIPACAAVNETLAATLQTDRAEDDMTGLLRAAQGNWSCVILALSDDSRDPAAMIRQMRVLDRTRTTPVLVYTGQSDARCVSALQAGANDMIFQQRAKIELVRRVKALALRKSVLEALRADAAAIVPLSDFDHATGLPGPTQLARSMPVSLERLHAQGKSVSLLLIAVDPISGSSNAHAVPDHIMLALTQVLRRSLRGFDFACRFSENCFAILMPGADAQGAEAVAQRICAEIKSEKVRLKDGRKDGTTASIGLATVTASSTAATASEMIATALDSLAKAQALGAAQVVAQQLKLAA